MSVWDRVFTKQFILMSTPLNLQKYAISNLFIHSSSVSKTLLALNLRRSSLSSQKTDAPAVENPVRPVHNNSVSNLRHANILLQFINIIVVLDDISGMFNLRSVLTHCFYLPLAFPIPTSSDLVQFGPDKKMIADPKILVCNHLLLVKKIFYNLKNEFLKHDKIFLDTPGAMKLNLSGDGSELGASNTLHALSMSNIDKNLVSRLVMASQKLGNFSIPIHELMGTLKAITSADEYVSCIPQLLNSKQNLTMVLFLDSMCTASSHSPHKVHKSTAPRNLTIKIHRLAKAMCQKKPSLEIFFAHLA